MKSVVTELQKRPLLVAVGVIVLTALASHLLPLDHSASIVGAIFLGATYALCLRGDQDPIAYGLSFGGLLERSPLRTRRILTETLIASGVALALAAIIFPFFYLGFQLWHSPREPFSIARAWTGLRAGEGLGALDVALGHLLAVALPEEAFFRGYLQSSLAEKGLHAKVDDTAAPAHALPYAAHSRAILVSSALFALGHFLTIPHPARLAVFFPSLAFGALRARTGGIGASVFFHALCNLYSAALFAGFGMT